MHNNSKRCLQIHRLREFPANNQLMSTVPNKSGNSKQLPHANIVGGVRHKNHKKKAATKVADEHKSKPKVQTRPRAKDAVRQLPPKQQNRKQQRQNNTKIQQPTPGFYFSKETPNR